MNKIYPIDMTNRDSVQSSRILLSKLARKDAIKNLRLEGWCRAVKEDVEIAGRILTVTPEVNNNA